LIDEMLYQLHREHGVERCVGIGQAGRDIDFSTRHLIEAKTRTVNIACRYFIACLIKPLRHCTLSSAYVEDTDASGRRKTLSKMRKDSLVYFAQRHCVRRTINIIIAHRCSLVS